MTRVATVVAVVVALVAGLTVGWLVARPDGAEQPRRPSAEAARAAEVSPGALVGAEAPEADGVPADRTERYAWLLTEIDWTAAEAEGIRAELRRAVAPRGVTEDRVPAAWGGTDAVTALLDALASVDADDVHPDLRTVGAEAVLPWLPALHRTLSEQAQDASGEPDPLLATDFSASTPVLPASDLEAALVTAGADAGATVLLLTAYGEWLAEPYAVAVADALDAGEDLLPASRRLPSSGGFGLALEALRTTARDDRSERFAADDLRPVLDATYLALVQVLLDLAPDQLVPAALRAEGGGRVRIDAAPMTPEQRAALVEFCAMDAGGPCTEAYQFVTRA